MDEKQQIQHKPRMQIVIEHLDLAYEHANQAIQILATMSFELQKGADFFAAHRDAMLKTLEEAGGDIDFAIEAKIKEFIPKKYKQPEAAE